MSDTPEKIIPTNEMLVMLCADLEADGMLSPDQLAALRVALARNPELQERYESFRFTRSPLASSFDAVLSAPVPNRLLRTVRESSSPGARQSAARRSSTRIWTQSRTGRGASLAWLGDVLRAPAFSPAAGIAVLAVSVAAGWLLHTAAGDGASSDARAFVASAPVQRALELTPSGVKADVARGVRLEPRLTFATEDKLWCRQYTLSYGEPQEAGGVACRNGDGVWQLVIETSLTAPPPPPSKGPLPAGEPPLADHDGPLPAVEPPLADHERILDSVRSQLKHGDVLGREEEEERIAEHWKRKP